MDPAALTETIILGVIGTGATTALGATAWGVRRVIQKQDKLDLLVRGDGNGNPGLGEQVRAVHKDVSHVKRALEDHIKGEAGRIQAEVLALKEELCDDA